MNRRAVAWLLGCVLLLLAGFLLVPALVALRYGEHSDLVAFVLTAAATALAGAALALPARGSTVTSEGRADYFRREGLAAVGLCWLLAAVVGALPFVVSGAIRSPVDAFFESASGFTTTGSTILDGAAVDRLSKSVAFWRSFTHWLGGIGIVLVFVVLFPTGGRSLFRSEVPGIAREAVQQRVRDSALGLVRVYVGLTGIEVLLLWLCGLGLYEAAIHSFGTLATGGFSNHSASIAFFQSWKVEAVIVVFMFAAGLNFTFYDSFTRSGARRAWSAAIRSSEVRAYALLMLGSGAFIAGVLWIWGGSNGAPDSDLPDYSRFTRAVRDSAFAVTSIQTSTGYATADFDRWPDVCRLMLMLLAVTGACAGSTGGGIKVVRFLILAKASLRGVKQFTRPRAIHPVRVDGETLDEGVVASVTGYFGLWVLVATGGTVALTAMNVDLVTASTGVLATLNNIGPGLAGVGPTAHFGHVPELGKLLLACFMILGRLEFYAVVALFVPSFWRH